MKDHLLKIEPEDEPLVQAFKLSEEKIEEYNKIQAELYTFNTAPKFREACTDIIKYEDCNIPLHNWRLRRHRLNSQVKDIRVRLSNRKAFVLAHDCINYSAESFWGVVWIYVKRWFRHKLKKNG